MGAMRKRSVCCSVAVCAFVFALLFSAAPYLAAHGAAYAEEEDAGDAPEEDGAEEALPPEDGETPEEQTESDPPPQTSDGSSGQSQNADSANGEDNGTGGDDIAIPHVGVADIEIDDYEDSIKIDGTVDLSATVLPADATVQTITYTSHDTSIATVNSKGRVKGIAAGRTTISLQAEDVVKTVPVTVTGADTTAISLNRTYLVLKPGGTFQITASVSPPDASQSLSYRSLDGGVAQVSGSGLVKADKIGSTSVLVSNGDLTATLFVIVNSTSAASGRGGGESGSGDGADGDEAEDGVAVRLLSDVRQAGDGGTVSVPLSDFPVVSETVLKALAESGATLVVEAEDYALSLAGADILNSKNVLFAGIRFQGEDGQFVFSLNDGNNLPGKVLIELKDSVLDARYLYLFNAAKDKYERLDAKDGILLTLDQAGSYLLSDMDVNGLAFEPIWIAYGIGAIGAGIAVYVVLRRRHLFW